MRIVNPNPVPLNIFFRNENKTKAFSDEENLRAFVARRSVFQEMLR
jgi:hypothetical protein